VLAAQVVSVVTGVTPAGAQALSVAMAGPLARVAMDYWARGVPAVAVALAAHRLASILWLAMAAAVVMVLRAALQPVARVVPVVPVVVPRVAHHHNS
jgi:hypothetical protein